MAKPLSGCSRTVCVHVSDLLRERANVFIAQEELKFPQLHWSRYCPSAEVRGKQFPCIGLREVHVEMTGRDRFETWLSAAAGDHEGGSRYARGIDTCG